MPHLEMEKGDLERERGRVSEERVWKRNTGGGRESRGGMWRKRVEMKKLEAASCFGQVPECLGMCDALIYGRFPQMGLSEHLNPQPCA